MCVEILCLQLHKSPELSSFPEIPSAPGTLPAYLRSVLLRKIPEHLGPAPEWYQSLLELLQGTWHFFFRVVWHFSKVNFQHWLGTLKCEPASIASMHILCSGGWHLRWELSEGTVLFHVWDNSFAVWHRKREKDLPALYIMVLNPFK